MKKNIEQLSIKENISDALKNMVGIDNLPIDYQANFDFNFFNWSKNFLVVNKDQKNQQIINKIILADDSYLKTDLEQKSATKKNFFQVQKQCRFSADLAFCYLKFHKFFDLTNNDSSDQFFLEHSQAIDDFERVRLLIQASNNYLGVAKNLIENIAQNIDNANINNLSLILLTKNKNLTKFLDFYPEIGIYCENIIKKLDNKVINIIEQLSTTINDQKKYTQLVIKLLQYLEALDQPKQSTSNQSDNIEKIANQEEVIDNVENVEKKLQEVIEQNDSDQQQSPENISEAIDLEKFKIIHEDQEDSTQSIIQQSEIDHSQIAYKNPYKIYSKKYDEVIFPQKLVNKSELQNLRNQLDLRINKLSGISKKMHFKLKRKLLSKRNTLLEFDSSKGVLDRKKLSSLILNPHLEEIWVNNKHHEYQDTVLTILLDNSGSMRGNPIVISAMACQIIADILQNFAVKTEIIGFTTGDWKGGRVRKLWEISNRPQNPGRLNELRHIIYKHFNQSFKKSKVNLGLMLKEGILKENIDGEAILFARSRLMQQNEKRKILLVISDGTPVDDSTTSNNSQDILTMHLHQVINKIEKQGKIEMVGIGIGHSTDEFYRNSLTIKNVEELGDAMIEKIADLL